MMLPRNLAALLTAYQQFTKQQAATWQTLTYASPIAIDAQLGSLYVVTLTGATAMLSNPTNLVAGQGWTLAVVQDGTGSRLMTYDTYYTFGTEGSPTLTTTAAKIDLISMLVYSTSKILCTTLKGF